MIDPKAKTRASELREEMKRASHEIAKDPARMHAAQRESIAPQVRNFVRQAERETRALEGQAVEKDETLSDDRARLCLKNRGRLVPYLTA